MAWGGEDVTASAGGTIVNILKALDSPRELSHRQSITSQTEISIVLKFEKIGRIFSWELKFMPLGQRPLIPVTQEERYYSLGLKT